MIRLNISERQISEITILDLSGDLVFGEGNVLLRTGIRRLLGEGKTKIFLNFARVGCLDSSGVGELVSGYTAVNREGGKLKLLNLPPRVCELLEITNLLAIFEVAENDAEAFGVAGGENM